MTSKLPDIDKPEREAKRTAFEKRLKHRTEGERLVFVRKVIDIRKLRVFLGLSSQEFAMIYGLSLRTLQNWESGRREPEGAAKSYLTAIAYDPLGVMQAQDDYRAGKQLPYDRQDEVNLGMEEVESPMPVKEMAFIQTGRIPATRASSVDSELDEAIISLNRVMTRLQNMRGQDTEQTNQSWSTLLGR